MIQRIQSVWLLLAALVMSGVFYFDVYHIASSTSDPQFVNATNIKNNFLAMALAGGSIILSLVAIFLFKNRKMQLNLTWLNILLCIGLLFWLFVGLNNTVWSEAGVQSGIRGMLGVAMFLPLIAVFLLIFALRGIRKDEKLIKSLDRLR